MFTASLFIHNFFLRNGTELTEEDMRRALFGGSETSKPATEVPTRAVTNIAIVKLIKAVKKMHTFQGFAPKHKIYAAHRE